jgi:hypothetical protein
LFPYARQSIHADILPRLTQSQRIRGVWLDVSTARQLQGTSGWQQMIPFV